MKLSDKQKRTIAEIKRIQGEFGDNRWFTRQELLGVGAGHNTLQALVEKGLLRYRNFNDTIYFQVIAVLENK